MGSSRLRRGVLFLLLVSGAAAYSQNPQSSNTEAAGGIEYAPLDISLSAFFTTPLGADISMMNYGGGGFFGGGYRLPFFPAASVDMGLQYMYVTTKDTPTISLISCWGGIGLEWRPIQFFGLEFSAGAGYSFGFLNPPIGFSGYHIILLKGGIKLRVFPFRDLSFDVGALINYEEGLYNGFTYFAGTTVELGRKAPPPPPPPPEPPVIVKIDLDAVFPVLFTFYRDHPIGKIQLKNDSHENLGSVTVSLFTTYMDNPQAMEPISLRGGETKEVDVFALFSDRILNVTEKTTVQAKIAVIYTSGGAQIEKIENIDVLDRNSITWDDVRKAAAFVTIKDTSVMGFAKNVISMVRDQGGSELNINLRYAIAMHEALNSYGITYCGDPSSTYAKFAIHNAEIDYLQFPRQTLYFKAGDCDDLTILNCALLEAVGIDAAFITIPGHIFMAFSIGKLDEASAGFANDTILIGDQSWIPVEITQIDGGFRKAWEMGVKEWNENSAARKLYILKSAWEMFPPVYFSEDKVSEPAPPNDQFVSAFIQELENCMELAKGANHE